MPTPLMPTPLLRVLLTVLIAVSAAGCASIPATPATSAAHDARDPFERVNRATFRFNDGFDRHLARPVATYYHRTAPRAVQTGAAHFFANLKGPAVFLNDALQGHLKPAGTHFARFIVNSTIGLAGLFDPGTRIGLTAGDADFSQTFGKWGIHSGPYLVLPILGPSTLRGTVALVPEVLTDPIQTVPSASVRWGAQGAKAVEARSDLLNVSHTMEYAYDPYLLLRSAYWQRDTYRIHGDTDSSDSAALADEELPALDDPKAVVSTSSAAHSSP